MPVTIVIAPAAGDVPPAATEELAGALRARGDVAAVEQRGPRLVVTAAGDTADPLLAALPPGFVGEVQTSFDPSASDARFGGAD